jgi:hypothetical protein
MAVEGNADGQQHAGPGELDDVLVGKRVGGRVAAFEAGDLQPEPDGDAVDRTGRRLPREGGIASGRSALGQQEGGGEEHASGILPRRMKRARIFIFNAVLAVVLAWLYAWLVVERRWDRLETAFLTTWWAGLTVGLSIGAGATLGPRPVLGYKKCVKTQFWVVVTSGATALLLSLLSREIGEVDRVVHDELARRGLRLSSGLGAIVGTVWQIIQVYRSRRRAARRP